MSQWETHIHIIMAMSRDKIQLLDVHTNETQGPTLNIRTLQHLPHPPHLHQFHAHNPLDLLHRRESSWAVIHSP